MFKIVLYQPEIPANTGNIGRLCVGTNCELHIIKPMRFMINDKYLKRAGLDYWEKLNFFLHDNLIEMKNNCHGNLYYCTTKTRQSYTEFNYHTGDIFVFGPESRGLPEELLIENCDKTINIPMSSSIRSLNLSNSVAIVLYEALRQVNYRGDYVDQKRRILC